MRILLIQLSDLHVADRSDPVLGRFGRIHDGVKDLESDIDLCIIAVTGDLAFAGTEEQYALVQAELCALRESLQKTCPGASVCICAIPGNHDCDFDQGGIARDMILDGASRDPAKVDESVVEVCTAVQSNFFDFLKNTAADQLALQTRLVYAYSITRADETVLIRCVNTAWCSRLREQPGTLFYPPQFLDAHTQPANLEVVLMHHPANWLIPDNSRIVRGKIEQTADIVLTGHEHFQTRRTQQTDNGGANEYIEGGVLQETGASNVSSFNALIVDTSARQQKLVKFSWDGQLYSADIAAVEWEELPLNRLRARAEFDFSESHASFVNDPGIVLRHRSRGMLYLNDIFVYPDLKQIDVKRSRDSAFVRGPDVFDRLASHPYLLVTGPDQSGKTALGKRLIADLHRRGFVPIRLDASSWKPSMNDGRLSKEIQRAFEDQYGREKLDEFLQLDRTRRVIIVDDMQRARVNRERRVRLIAQLRRFAGRVVVFSSDVAQNLDDFGSADGAAGSDGELQEFQIQPFGHFLRNALVERWFALDAELTADEETFAAELMEITRKIDSIIGRNYVPAYPVFILAVLQARDADVPVDLRASTHGYFYEIFIRAALARATTKKDFDIKISYLSFMAYRLFERHAVAITFAELTDLHREYEDTYAIRLSMDGLIDSFIEAQVLKKDRGYYRFKYSYIYNYFVASYLRDHIAQADIRSAITRLSSRLSVSEDADILLFLTHLTRDPFVVEQMVEAADTFYASVEPAQLSTEELAFLKKIDDALFRRVVLERSPLENRRESLRQMDELERTGEHASLGVSGDKDDSESSHDTDAYSLPVAFKHVQILGQVLKNFPGSLEAKDKLRIAGACYRLGLRALARIFELIRTNEEEIVAGILQVLRTNFPRLENEALVAKAQESFTGLVHVLCYAVVNQIALFVGAAELEATYRMMVEQNPHPSVRLIDASIKVDHVAGFPDREVIHLAAELKGNPFALNILRVMVIHHFYLFPVKYDVRQRVCSALGIRVEQPRLMSSRRKLLKA